MATKPKFYVTVATECSACEGTGGTYSDPCTDCRGTGTIEDATELMEALTILGIIARLDGIERTANRAAYYSEAQANGGF